MVSVQRWTGQEAHYLRLALRLSVRSFADRLGLAVRTVAKWEQLLERTCPYPDSQAILDTALARATAEEQARFETLLAPRHGPGLGPRARSAEYETWSEDLDRTVVCLSRQNFAFADSLLGRWLAPCDPHTLDEHGLYLYARSLVLRGDLQRDQGRVHGPLSAGPSYTTARSVFAELEIPRRIAQIELSLAVVAEMAGSLQTAARRYEELAADDRLSPRDRARSRLWVGTALSKDGDNIYAVQVMSQASQELERLVEPDDWAVAQQKLALAHRGAGELTQALHYIDIARSSGTADSPMQRVRVDTAYGHILLSDPATLDDGHSVLDQAAQLAGQFGLSHQLRSIEGIRRTATGAPVSRRS